MAYRPDLYKMVEGNKLPKFTGMARPGAKVSSPARPASPTGPAPLLEDAQTAAELPPLPEENKLVASEPAILNSPFAPGAAPVAKPWFREFWTMIFSFFKRLVQRFILGRKGRLLPPKTVQTELALDKVTVLRNDLNDDDLEVVLVKRKVGTEKPLARLRKMEMTGDAWEMLTAPFRKKSESADSTKEEAKPSPELSARV